jgi:hypothetical protein
MPPADTGNCVHRPLIGAFAFSFDEAIDKNITFVIYLEVFQELGVNQPP